VSNIEKTKYGSSGRHGYSFRVETAPNAATLLTVTYENEAEALAAEKAMRKIIEGAADVMSG
jgi:hypothetical protein